MCWVIHTVVARSWAVSGRVIHNLQLSTICALLATYLRSATRTVLYPYDYEYEYGTARLFVGSQAALRDMNFK